MQSFILPSYMTDPITRCVIPEMPVWSFTDNRDISNFVLKGDQLLVKVDCFCEGYLHEMLNYPRKGLKVKQLKKGDTVFFDGYFENFFGVFCIVSFNGERFDVKVQNLSILKPYTVESWERECQEWINVHKEMHKVFR